MLSNQCLITLPEVRTKGLVPKVRHTHLRLSVNEVEGHVGLTQHRKNPNNNDIDNGGDGGSNNSSDNSGGGGSDGDDGDDADEEG